MTTPNPLDCCCLIDALVSARTELNNAMQRIAAAERCYADPETLGLVYKADDMHAALTKAAQG